MKLVLRREMFVYQVQKLLAKVLLNSRIERGVVPNDFSGSGVSRGSGGRGRVL